MKTLSIFALTLFLIIFFYGVHFYKQARILTLRGVKTTGNYIGFKTQTGSDVKSRNYRNFEFFTLDNIRYTVAEKRNSISITDAQITIIYDPENPENASIDSFFERQMVWIILVSTGGLGFLSWMTILILRFIGIIPH